VAKQTPKKPSRKQSTATKPARPPRKKASKAKKPKTARNESGASQAASADKTRKRASAANKKKSRKNRRSQRNRRKKKELETKELTLHALRVMQGKKDVYEFAVDGKIIDTFTEVSRIRRSEGGRLEGYQRPEATKHIQEIREYIDTADAIIPNAPVIGFDNRVTFTRLKHVRNILPYVEVGTLSIPLVDPESNQSKPGKIVDGQQRLAAIRDAERPRFPISIVAFIADDEREFSTNFIRVNNVKPLKTTLETELITTIDDPDTLPERLAKKHAPSLLVEKLALDDRSSLNDLITRETNPKRFITEQSMIEMIGNSLSDGLLYEISGNENLSYAQKEDLMFCLLSNYWEAVKETFPDAWGLHPKDSRLMHGAGIVSMGFLMEDIANRELGEFHRSLFGNEPNSKKASEFRIKLFMNNLVNIKRSCHWTSGTWDFGETHGGAVEWNQIENTPAWKKRLTKHLKRLFKKQRGQIMTGDPDQPRLLDNLDI
jgi:DGQHR domain-containing protein